MIFIYAKHPNYDNPTPRNYNISSSAQNDELGRLMEEEEEDMGRKIKILKSGFLHVREGQIFINIGSQMGDISVNKQRANFNTGPYGDPLKNQNFENRASTCFKLAPKLGLEPKFHESGTFDGFGKRGQSFILGPLVAEKKVDRHAYIQDSCFISIDMFFNQ